MVYTWQIKNSKLPQCSTKYVMALMESDYRHP